jgi:hypothetical protein
MFYIYATRRDDLTRYYWNRRKAEWQEGLAPACYYPTAAGVNRVYMGMANAGLVWRRFHELGFKRAPDEAERIRLSAWGHGGQTV